MSLNPVLSSSGSQQPIAVAKRGAGDASAVGHGGRDPADTVRLSDQGRMMSRLPDRMPPTPENVRKLSTALAGDLKGLLRRNGVDTRREVGFEVDLPAGKISVTGDGADAPAVTALIGSQPGIERQIRDLAVLGRHVHAVEQGADARLANRLAQSAAQISSVVADYVSRFGEKNESQDFAPLPGRRGGGGAGMSNAIANYTTVSATAGEAVNISLLFNGTDVQVRANGKPWLSSRT